MRGVSGVVRYRNQQASIRYPRSGHIPGREARSPFLSLLASVLGLILQYCSYHCPEVAVVLCSSPSPFPAYVCTATCFLYARLLKDFLRAKNDRPHLFLLLFHAFDAERVDEQMATLVEASQCRSCRGAFISQTIYTSISNLPNDQPFIKSTTNDPFLPDGLLLFTRDLDIPSPNSPHLTPRLMAILE